MKKMSLLLWVQFMTLIAVAQPVEYPHPVRHLSLTIEQQPVKMAYMDVAPATANGKTVLLLHGKNFNGYYWKGVIPFLQQAGFRVVVPDQVGWGKSDKPNIHYSFHLLAANTRQLLDTLGIRQAIVLGHSMGGMLATRFALMYPHMVERLIYENPIGLEDYKTFVPYRSVDAQYASELKATPESLRQYQQSYYPQWKLEYNQYVTAQYDALQIPNFNQATWASALTYQMIYEQPVVYEFKNITAPTLIIIGQEDRTVVGKGLLGKPVADRHGNYPPLGRWLQQQIKGSSLVALPGVGHIPHIQAPESFQKAVLQFIHR
jgi:pimeloyl-ACP methyl ester carboxylesterase